MFMPSTDVPSASFIVPRTINPGPGPSVGRVGLDVGVSVGVRDESTVWVAGGGVNVCVDVWVAVDVAGIGVCEGVPVSATLVDVGVGSGRDD